MPTFNSLNRKIVRCQSCPRLLDHCRHVAREKRRAFRDWDYWGRPVPNLGAAPAPLLIVGLAPAAHGANRTGRMFTGDRSGDWLFASMHRAGFTNQPEATDRHDGLQLIDCTITAVCHCAPPQNKPTREEIVNCRTWLEMTIDLCRPRVLLGLGQAAFTAIIHQSRSRGWLDVPRQPRFEHGGEIPLSEGRCLLSSYHPSQQNTFTGRLTREMLDAVFRRARELVGKP